MNYKTKLNHQRAHEWDDKGDGKPGIDVNARKPHKSGKGATPAFLAAKHGSLEVLMMLHERGAVIEGEGSEVVTKGDQIMQPIHIAAKNGHRCIVDFLLSKTKRLAV